MDLSTFVATQSQNGFGRVDADGFPLKKDHSNPIPSFPSPPSTPPRSAFSHPSSFISQGTVGSLPMNPLTYGMMGWVERRCRFDLIRRVGKNKMDQGEKNGKISQRRDKAKYS